MFNKSCGHDWHLTIAVLMHFVASTDPARYLATPMLDLAALLKAKGWSDRKAGAEVLARWRRRDRRAKFPKAEGIAVKIGLLREARDTWWRNHPHALASLAELLACRPEDLLPPGGAVGAVDFVEFRELAPLLPGQEPAHLRIDGSIGSLAEAA